MLAEGFISLDSDSYEGIKVKTEQVLEGLKAWKEVSMSTDVV